MRKIAVFATCLALAACSHIPFFSKAPSSSGKAIGVVEYDTGLTKYSTVTGIYHQDMCSKADPDAHVHLSDKEMKSILSLADKTGFYSAPADLTTDWSDSDDRPAHCANFRLRIESGGLHNEVRWNCMRNGSNEPPVGIAPLALQIQKILQSKPEVRALPWSSCQVL
jgi:hypothetical protein